jgi:hypothetical protein
MRVPLQMLRSVLFAAVVALAVASPMGPARSPYDDDAEALSGHAAEALERMAREVVGEGREEEECDNENEKYKWVSGREREWGEGGVEWVGEGRETGGGEGGTGGGVRQRSHSHHPGREEG